MNYLNWINDNKELVFGVLFSGAGVSIVGKIISFFVKKKTTSESHSTINNTATAQGDNSNAVVGNGNQISTTYNYYGSEDVIGDDVKESDFSKRYFLFRDLLNESKRQMENPYTDEKISSLLELSNVKDLQKYLNTNETPDDAFKEKFVEIFGVNREWMVYGQGDKPFKSNIKYHKGYDPTEIVSEGFLNSDDKIIFVVGHDEDNKQIGMFVIKHNEHFYEVVPKQFTFNPNVGAGGTSNLVKLYDVIKELDNKNILDSMVYLANSEQTKSLFYGDVAPKAVLKLSHYNGFLNCFLDIDQESIERNIKEKFLERDIIEVQKIISVEKGLYCEKTISTKTCSTEDFSNRFGLAFPGVRDVEIIDDPKECVKRLEILLGSPIESNAIWMFRGTSTEAIDSCKKVSESKILLNSDEICLKKIYACYSSHYYKKFVYVEAEPENPSGAHEITQDEIEYWISMDGYCHEEYALYNGNAIKRTEYDDGAANIDGKIVELNGKAELRIRYLSPYNFIICAHFNPINNNQCDYQMEKYLNGILAGNRTVDDIRHYIENLPKHRNNHL